MAIALVTGGGGEGSGCAIARRFAREGAMVVICDVDAAGCERTAGLITHDGGRAVCRTVDVRSREQLSEAFAFACSMDSIEVVVNNASATGAYHPEAPLEYWDELVATDFLGAMWSTRLAIDAMHESGGSIVNVSSTSALPHERSGGSPMYDVAKMAILRLSTRLAFLREQNIRVNCIVPHWIATPEIVEYVSQLSPEQRAQRGVPARLIPVDEIADVVYRLASDPSFAGEAVIWPDGREPQFLTNPASVRSTPALLL